MWDLLYLFTFLSSYKFSTLTFPLIQPNGPLKYIWLEVKSGGWKKEQKKKKGEKFFGKSIWLGGGGGGNC